MQTETTSDNASAKPTRRFRSPHPGVKLKPPTLKVPYWRARFVDPDTAKSVDVRVPSTVSTKSQRRDWAIRKSRDLIKRQAELDAGAVRKTGGSLEDAVALFVEKKKSELRKKTMKRYKVASNHMLAWATANGIALDSFGLPQLMDLREHLHDQPKRYATKRGTTRSAGKPRSRASVNSDLRAIGTILNYLRRRKMLPRISIEDLKDGLQKYGENKAKPEFLTVHELQTLFAACERHDAETFRMTREERTENGQRKTSRPGRTPRFIQIAPFALTAVLSGMRLEELCSIEWSTHVDLEAIDYQQKPIGQISLRAQDTKIHEERTVFLDVSPMLRELFLALERASGGTGRVFDEIDSDVATATMKRLRKFYGAPKRFTWQRLRATCATFLACAPAIYGAAAPFHAAQQLGHSTDIQKKHYAGRIPGIPNTVRTLEAAMQIEAHAKAAITRITSELEHDNVVTLKRR